MEEQILPQEAQPGAHGELEEFVDGPDEGDVWRLVDDDYYRVAEAEPDEDPEDVDPVKSALLWQYSIAKLSRQTVGVTPEQLAAIRRRRQVGICSRRTSNVLWYQRPSKRNPEEVLKIVVLRRSGHAPVRLTRAGGVRPPVFAGPAHPSTRAGLRPVMLLG